MNPEQAVKAWKEEFEKLSPERQEAVQQWYAVQAYLAQELGLELEKWMEYVQWAFAHPLDYSFIAEFPDLMKAMESSDGFETSTNAAAALLGTRPPAFSPPDEEKSGNSLFDMMLGRGDKETD